MSTISLSDNLILNTDSYKHSHHKQYPPGTTQVYCYFECRGGKFPEVVFFGLQYLLKRWLVGRVVTEEKIAEAKEVCLSHFGRDDVFNEEGWRLILKEHNGHLPLRIRAVPEGTVVPTRNVLFTVENTDPTCFWLPGHVETLLVQVWYPITVATNSRAMKQVLGDYLERTADSVHTLPNLLHDFGCRGSTSFESAGLGGMAHLVSFAGTDTMPALTAARRFYACPMAGRSIPAAEHSTITAWGREGELDAYRNMLTQFPTGTIACVSDSYDIYRVCEEFWGHELRNMVVERGKTKAGCLVVRPDSGDPPTVVVKVLEILGKAFGLTKNNRGYRVLPSCIRVIQGDGISFASISGILEAVMKAGFSTENLVFGSGGGLLQQFNRDTQKCAYKCSFALVKGKPVNVFKDPVTDSGKRSKKGLLTLEKTTRADGRVCWRTADEGTGDPSKDILQTVYENGRLIRDQTLEDVRSNARIDSDRPNPSRREISTGIEFSATL